MTEPLLEIRDLKVTFATAAGPAEAVSGIDLTVDRGGVLGVVGESGSGKSISMMAIMGLLPRTARVSGSARLGGAELIGMPAARLQRIRGKRIGMIFQDPLTALNPVHRVGDQIAEALWLHDRTLSRHAAFERARELLDLVAIPQAGQRVFQYPHEFSGGMRQRVMIAMAVANDPDLLIADEPTTALDVTVQAQILDVLSDLRERLGIGLVLITHDLGVVAGTADHVAVMYSGRIVERGPVDDVFYATRHPYTQGLLRALPGFEARGGRLTAIEGVPPSLTGRPGGCAFHPRCPHGFDRCRVERPVLTGAGAHVAACHLVEETPVAAAAAATIDTRADG